MREAGAGQPGACDNVSMWAPAEGNGRKEEEGYHCRSQWRFQSCFCKSHSKLLYLRLGRLVLRGCHRVLEVVRG